MYIWVLDKKKSHYLLYNYAPMINTAAYIEYWNS